MKRRSSRNTKGLNAVVFVAEGINYTTDATLKEFIDNAPVGEIGIYDGALDPARHTDAITATEELMIIMKLTDGVKTAPLMKKSEIVAKKSAYVAPVKQVSSVGLTAVGGSLNLGAISAGDEYAINVIDTSSLNQPFDNYNYPYVAKTGDTQMDIVQDLAKQINNFDISKKKRDTPIVGAKVISNGTYGNFAMTGTTPTLTFTNGSTVVAIGGGTPAFDGAVGDYLAFHPSATPTALNSSDVYKIVAVVAGVSVTLNRAFAGTTKTLTEAEAEGTRLKRVTVSTEVGLELTSLDFDTHFRIGVRQDFANATITYTTDWKKGIGTYEDARDAENEGAVFAGNTAVNTQFPESYGSIDKFAVSGETYDVYSIINTSRRASAGAPRVEDVGIGNILIYAAKSAGNVGSTLDTLLGL